MRGSTEPDERAAPIAPMAKQSGQTDGISGTNSSQTLSVNHASYRSPSPFEASTTPRSRNNSVNASSTRHGDLYNATPSREIAPPNLTVSSADTSDEDETSSDSDDDITNGVKDINLGASENDAYGSSEEEDISAALSNLNVNQQTDSSGSDVCLYSIRNEPLPAEPYYEQAFQISLRQGTQLAGQVAACVERCAAVDDPNSSLHKLNREALALSEYKAPTTRTIGIVGKSGSGKFPSDKLWRQGLQSSPCYLADHDLRLGKSSLINSLLHVNELALTGSAGTAVTAFATEYRYQPAHDAPNFTAVAYCLNAEEIDENLAELLEDFHKPYTADRNQMTGDEFKEAEDRSDAAKTIFETAFGRIDDFHIEHIAHEEGGYERALECVKRWARQLEWPTGTCNGRWEASAITPGKLQRQMKPFLSLGLWPFVKRVVIYLKSPVLRNGLVLADLPGYHDVNYARVAAAKNFQSTCDEIFVVTDIKRGVDDPIIKEVIQEMSSAAGVGKTTRPNITVICSHAGDLGTDQDKRKLRQKVPASKIKHAQKQIDKLKRRAGPFTDAFRAMEEAKMNMDELLIRARNKEVKINLQAKYSEHFLPKQMPVYCIDNSLYHNQNSPLAVEVSGIPDLRRYCLSLPGRALFRSADTFLENRLPALINSLEIWLEAAHNADTQSLSDVVDLKRVRDVLDPMLNDWKASFCWMCNDSLRDPCNRKVAGILANACDTAATWKGMHHSSYLAWVRKEGTHQTKTVGYKCWNTELVASLNHVLTPYWVSLDSEAETDLYAVSGQMQGHLEMFRKAATGAGAPTSLVHNLAARQRLVETVFADGIEDFMRSFRLIKRNATSGGPTSYVLSYMHPVYKMGKSDCGSGVTERNIRRIGQHVANSEFVTSQSRRIRHDLKELAERTVDSLSEKVHLIFDATAADLETIEAPDTALLEKHPAFGRSVEEILDRARAELESIELAVTAAREEARSRGYI